MTDTFPNSTVTIDDVSESRAWERELWHRAAQRGQAPANVPASKKPTNQHGKTS